MVPKRLFSAIAAIAIALGVIPAYALTQPTRVRNAAAFDAASSAPDIDPWRLVTNSFTGDYSPAYVGNGYLGTRVPAEGEGYETAPVATETHVAGLYDQTADSRGVPLPPGEVTAMPIAAPQWSGLEYDDGSGTWSTQTGRVLRYRQTLDLRAGIMTTRVTWRGRSGHVTDLRYDLYVSRARLHIGVVRLQLTPHWTGDVTVRDVLGPGGATLAGGAQPIPLVQYGSGLPDAGARINRYDATTRDGSASVAETSRLLLPNNQGTKVSASAAAGRDVVSATLPVQRGRTYTVTKVAAIVGSAGSQPPAAAADRYADGAAAAGPVQLQQEHAAAWQRLWRSRVDVLGDPALAQVVHASEFYLLSSFDRRVRWSASPAGLSSGGYNGHVFWDSETWMYPALLAGHPDLAAAVDAYRQRLLPAARKYAAAGGYRGARFPWESARSGGEESPPPWSAFEQHISADVALAQWQYYLATGNRRWLGHRAYPLLSAVADFWASRAVHTSGYELLGMMGPDEYNYPVDNSTYTNVAARTALRIALHAAQVLHRPAPAIWRAVADGLVVPFDPALGIHPEYDGYRGGGIKQADVVMLTYPWEAAESRRAAAADLAYYMPRTDPGGPSMTDSIHAIDTLALHLRGCASYTLLRRSMDPFLRPPFDQFAETRTGGAFNFLTGTGGFLQEFSYGFSGLRWRSGSLRLDPSLPPQLAGVVLRRLSWHGRVVTVRISHVGTTVRLDRGPAMVVSTPQHRFSLATSRPVHLATSDPARAGRLSLLQCRPAIGAGTRRGSYAFAAVDGSVGTTWEASAPVSTLTIRLPRVRLVHDIEAQWSVTTQTWSTYVGPPIQTTARVDRPTSYDVLVSTDGRSWRRVATVTGTGALDHIRVGARAARWVRLRCHVPAPGIELAELRAG